MSKKNIKGITLEIGGNVQPLNKALEGVNKTSRDLQSELRQVDRLLKLDPKNTELLAQKQKLLGDAVSNTRDKLSTLKEAERQVQEQFKRGEVSEEQYRAIQREVIQTERNLKDLESQLKNVNNRWKDASQAVGDFGKKTTDTGKNLTKGLTAPILGAGAAAIGLAAKAGQTADRILDLRDITGMSTDAIQEYQYVANQAGVGTEAMTSAMEGLIRKIPQLESEGGRATEQLEKLGLTYADLKAMSPDEQVDALMSSLAAMTDVQERNAIGAQLFGRAWKDIAPILGMGADGISKAREEAKKLGIVMSEDALNDANDFRKEMDKFRATVDGLVNQLGAKLAPVLSDIIGPLLQDTIVPAITALVDRIAKVAEWFSKLSPTWQKIILAAIVFAAAIGPLLILIGSMATGLASIIGLFGGTTVAAGGATAATAGFGASMAAALLPILAVIAAVALVAAGVYLLIKNWDTVKEFFLNLWESIKEIFAATWEWLKDLFFRYHPLGLVIKNWDTIKEFFSGLWERVKEIFSGAMRAVAGFVIDRFLAIVNFLTGIRDRIIGIFDKIKDGILGIWDKIFSGIKGFVNRIIEVINGMIGGMNKLQWDVPNWVPIIGGKKWGVNIPRIPLMDTGGIVKGPGVFQVGPGVVEVVRRYNPAANASQEVRHSGTIRIEGVNNKGQLIAAADMLIEGLNDPRARLALDRAQAKLRSDRLTPLGGRK